jgi:hypothetical protein
MNHYVALPFIPMDHGLAPSQAMECPSEAALFGARRPCRAMRPLRERSLSERRASPRQVGRCRDPEDLWRRAVGFPASVNDVTRRKGEYSKSRLDCEFSHQVILPARSPVPGRSHTASYRRCCQVHLPRGGGPENCRPNSAPASSGVMLISCGSAPTRSTRRSGSRGIICTPRLVASPNLLVPRSSTTSTVHRILLRHRPALRTGRPTGWTGHRNRMQRWE